MPLRLDAADPGFEAAFARLVADTRESDADVTAAVAAIIADVRARGDAALLELTERFDRVRLTAETLAVGETERAQAAATVPAELRAALELAAERIRDFHWRQLPRDDQFRDAAGVRLGQRWRPVAAAGLYVPGGKAAYPSSVLMNAIPAWVAGVRRMVMTVPCPDGVLNGAVLYAAELAGVSEIYRIGGAQAIAALAYGTASIAPVDCITGPGNAYVAAAKRQVFGQVGIDSIAGPSEILVLADAGNDPAWIAADLLSQAEHDEVAQAILITDDAAFADQVVAAVAGHLAVLPRAAIAGQSWERYGAVIVVPDLAAALPLIDRLAPEHLELAVAEPAPLLEAVRNAGAIFVGRHTPEAVGDYVAGPNHVLPTGRTARFSSGLSVHDFLRRSAVVECDPAALAAIGPAAMILAEAEGLAAHALSIGIRLNRRS